jgi:hypothetical protein
MNVLPSTSCFSVNIYSLVLLCSDVKVSALHEYFRIGSEMINELSIVKCSFIVFDSWMA